MAKAPSKFSDVTILKYKKGEQIIKQGDYGISIYIILNGYVEVFRESEGADLVLGTLGPGDIFGEMIFLNRGVEVHSASARALQDSEIEVWHPDELAKKYEEIAPVLKALISAFFECTNSSTRWPPECWRKERQQRTRKLRRSPGGVIIERMWTSDATIFLSMPARSFATP
jgi:CRP-like cAMP-binding protein